MRWLAASRQCWYFGLVLLFCVLLLIVLRLRATDPLGVRMDSWSEANIIVSARNVGANGWSKYAGVAQHQVDRPPFQNDPFFYYTQYPLGASYIAWALYTLGYSDIECLRWVPDLMSVATVVLWYAWLRRFLAPSTAVISTLVLGTSFGFLAYADDLHHGYSLTLLLGTMLSYTVGTARSGGQRHLLMATAWILLLLNSFMSWEWHLWSQVFLWAHAWIIGVPFRKRWLLLFALPPLIALGVQQAVRGAVLGSDAGAGLAADVLRRTIRFEETADTPLDVTLRTYPLIVWQRFREFYGLDIGMLIVLVLGWGVVAGGLRRSAFHPHPALRWLVVLFLCSLTWWAVMLQHTAVHPHVMRHALFFYALAVGLILSEAARVLGDRRHSVWLRTSVAALLLCVLWPHAERAYRNIQMHSDRAYRLPNGWAAGWTEGQFLTDVANHLPADAILLTNYNRPPLLRYWAERPVYAAGPSLYPFHRSQPLPHARRQVELVTSHLHELYGDRLPRIAYVYFFSKPPATEYLNDPVLRLLVNGVWEDVDPTIGLARLGDVVAGHPPASAYPILARGTNWIAFDAAKLPDTIRRAFPGQAAPTRVEFGPPR